jgi:5-methylcytosine-specific restriction endonuclease McrA
MRWTIPIVELFRQLGLRKLNYKDTDAYKNLQKFNKEHPTIDARNNALAEMSWQGSEAERRAEYAKLIERHPDLRQELEDYAKQYPNNFIPPDIKTMVEKSVNLDEWVKDHFADIESFYQRKQLPWAKGSTEREKAIQEYRIFLDEWKTAVEASLKSHRAGHDTKTGEKWTDAKWRTHIINTFWEKHGYHKQTAQDRIGFTQEMRQVVLAKNAGRCYICGEPIGQGDYEIEHIKPLSKGGTNHISNLMPSHKSCNRSKGMKSISEL